ncbi:MAG: hypothetical protein ABSA65_12605 [Acidimicrobiales bacterium]|jgi:hypothetical protein
MPEGTLLLNFDPSEDVPAEFVMKAGRYGWPAASELVPVFLTVDGIEAGEPGRDDVRVLAVALAALLEHDAAGPTPVEIGPKVTSGKLELAKGGLASFSIRQLPRSEDDANELAREGNREPTLSPARPAHTRDTGSSDTHSRARRQATTARRTSSPPKARARAKTVAATRSATRKAP